MSRLTERKNTSTSTGTSAGIPTRYVPTASRQTGFTLIELLVVIAIISILASILFPAFATAREKGRQTACLSNIKQLTTAFIMYTQDYDEVLPGAGRADTNPICSIEATNSWVLKQRIDENTSRCVPEALPLRNGALYPYVKNEQVYACVSDLYGRTKTLSYSMNSRLSSVTIAAIGTPTDCVLLVDEGRTLNDGSFEPPAENRPADAASQGYLGYFLQEQPKTQHNGGANISFADGHAKWFRPEMMRPHQFNLNQ